MSMYGTAERTAWLADALPGSKHHALSELPVTNDVPNACGQLLLLPLTGLIVVPFVDRSPGYGCVVVQGNEHYPRGGYDLYIGPDEIVRAIPVELVVPS
jgi:hypothetical protein